MFEMISAIGVKKLALIIFVLFASIYTTETGSQYLEKQSLISVNQEQLKLNKTYRTQNKLLTIVYNHNNKVISYIWNTKLLKANIYTSIKYTAILTTIYITYKLLKTKHVQILNNSKNLLNQITSVEEYQLNNNKKLLNQITSLEKYQKTINIGTLLNDVKTLKKENKALANHLKASMEEIAILKQKVAQMWDRVYY